MPSARAARKMRHRQFLPVADFSQLQNISLPRLCRALSSRAEHRRGTLIMNSNQYQQYLKSGHWTDVKRRFKSSKLYRGCCECCENRNVPLHVHHKTYKRLGSEKLNDLVTVCAPCHTEIHQMHRNNRRDGLWIMMRRLKKRIN